MPTKSEYVTDDMIRELRNVVKGYRKARYETELAISAGFTPEMSLKEIDEKINNTIKIIETYTGEKFRE